MGYLTTDDLIAGSNVTHDVEIPPSVLSSAEEKTGSERTKVRLRPLTVKDVQRISKAAKDNDTLLSVLMLKEGLVEPVLSFDQVNTLNTGLARFLVSELNRISGLSVDDGGIAAAVQAPLAKACFVLAREFGWSPSEVGDLTLGQVMLYLEMINQDKKETQ